MVSLDVEDGYWDLPQKSLHMFNYVAGMDFDYVFKCDDDTYVRMDRLPEVCWGDFVGDESLNNEHNPYASGGAGYMLSKKIISKIIVEDIPLKGLEDVIFSSLALKNTGLWRVDARLYYGQKLNDNITCHWLSPQKMMVTHIENYSDESDFLYYRIRHSGWDDDIKVHIDSGYFRRMNYNDEGFIEYDGEDFILKWDKWSPERFSVCGDTWHLTKND